MRHNFLLLLSVVFLSLATWLAVKSAPLPATSPSGGEALVAQPAGHDFGSVRQGEVLRTAFVLKNAGRSQIRIVSWPTDCGCTVAKLGSPTLETGKETALDVTLETGASRGVLERKVDVRYLVERGVAGEEFWSLPLTVRADVAPDYSLKPPEIKVRKDERSDSAISFVPGR